MTDIQPILATIHSLSNQGAGVGKLPDGKTVFVPLTLPEEEVLVQIQKEKKSFSKAKLVRIEKQSPNRTNPFCKHFQKCGGCSWQHIQYKTQMDWKQKIVEDHLNRIAKLDSIPSIQLVPSLQEKKSRTRVRFQVSNKGALGFYEKESHKTVSITECPVSVESIEQNIPTFQRLMVLLEKPFWPCELQVLVNQKGDFLVEVVSTSFKASISPRTQKALQALVSKKSNWKGLEVRNAKGSCFQTGLEYIQDTETKLEYKASSFAQASFAMNSVFLSRIRDIVASHSPKTLWEFHAGRGNITFSLLQAFPELSIQAFEISKEAVEKANERATKEATQKASFVIFDDENDDFPVNDNAVDFVLLDPPRRGCPPKLVQQLLALSPETILFVSCDSANGARDIQLLQEQYSLEQIVCIDFMPQTPHIEALFVLKKRKGI